MIRSITRVHNVHDVIQLVKMTTAQVVETSVTVNNNSPIQDYVHQDDQTQPTLEMTTGFKPFTREKLLLQLGQAIPIPENSQKYCKYLLSVSSGFLSLPSISRLASPAGCIVETRQFTPLLIPYFYK